MKFPDDWSTPSFTKDKIIFAITEDMIQQQANQLFDRNLTSEELLELARYPLDSIWVQCLFYNFVSAGIEAAIDKNSHWWDEPIIIRSDEENTL